MPTHKDAPKRSNNILIGVLALIVILLLVALLAPKSDEAVAPTNNEDTSESAEPEQVNTATNFDWQLPEDWDGVERAQKNIQSLGEGQRIAFGIVEDPTDENIVYFASSKYISEVQATLVSVYRYNNDDFTFERLYRNNFKAGEFPGLDEGVIPELHVLGYDSGRLVLLAQDMSDSPGPCANPWLLADNQANLNIRRMVSMDIEAPYDGFEEYDVPEEVTEAAKQEETRCVANMGG